MTFYNNLNETGFYGEGLFYNISDVDILANLSFYRTSASNTYVFHWGFSPIIISPNLFTFDYELQLDVVPTFDSPNLEDFTSGIANDTTQSISFHVTSVVDSTHLIVDSTTGMMSGDTITQGINVTTITIVTDSTQLVVGSTIGWIATNVITYQNGNVRKGYAVPVADRIDFVEQTWYARVRIINGMETGPWSVTLTWTIPAKQQQYYAESIMKSLPDYHVYGKEDLLKPVLQRNSNLYLVDNMYGNQLDAASYENFLTQTDNYIDLCRDEFLQQNFGVLFEFTKPVSMQYVDYRWILKQLILASLEGSTNEAISRVVAAFTGVSPLLLNVRDENDFFLNTIQDNPIVPSGPQTVFHTSYPFVPSTLSVEDITTGLFIPSSDYTTNPVQGTWTMNIATADILQATFNIGTVNDPFPVVFDGTDYTVLSGTATFTKNSNLITGTGTFFTSQLSTGNQITDIQGIYIGTVDTISDDTHLSLVQPWFGPTETVGIFKLKYTDIQLPPPINWAKETLAWGLIIDVLNPGEFLLNDSLIQTIGSGVLPAAAKVYWEFPS